MGSAIRLAIGLAALCFSAGCGSTRPAIQAEMAPDILLKGAERVAVLPFRIVGYSDGDIPDVVGRTAQLVEIAVMREGFPVVLQASFADILRNLRYTPAITADVPSARILAEMTGADLVIEGSAETVRVGVLNTFRQTLYAIDPKAGRVILTVTGEGDSQTYLNCARELAQKLRKAVP